MTTQVPEIAVGLTAGPSDPVEVGVALVDPLRDWASRVDGVPAPGGDAVPPTLPAVLALTDRAGRGGAGALLAALLGGIPGAAVVHGDQRLESLRPLGAGDRVVFTSRVVSVRAMGGAQVVAVATAVDDAADCEPVARLRSTFVLGSSGPGAAS